MGKRQKRFDRGSITERVSEITGKTINIVLVTREVMHARFVELKGHEILLENDRKKRTTIHLNRIEEIILDY